MRTIARSCTLSLLAFTACASSRAPGGDGDDDGAGTETDADTETDAGTETDARTETDATTATDDASTVAPCTAGNLETVAAWPKQAGGLQTAPAIAVGPGGELVAAYNVDDGPVMIATRGAGGVWTATPITTLGSFPSIAFAPDGTLHACFVSARSDSTGPLVCRSRPPGGAWSAATTVDANVSRLPSVAIDPYGRLNVGYARAEGPAIASQSSGGGWSLHVMTGGGTAEAASLAYGPPGSEQLVWTMWSAGYPSLFERATGFVDGTFAWVRPRSLAIDGHGRVHVGFARYRNEQISYAYRDADNVWHFEHDLDGDGLIVPWSMALALGAVGKVHVTYTERAMGQTPERVRHAVRSFGTWTTETIYDAPAEYFSTTAVAASSDGGIHIVFDALPAATPDLRTVYYVRRCEAVDPL